MRDWLKARWWWGGAKKYVEPRLRGLLKGKKVRGTRDVLAGISNHKPGFLFPISAAPSCSIWFCQVNLTAGQATIFLPPFSFIFLMSHNGNINILSFLLAKRMTSNMDWLYIWHCSGLWLLFQDIPGFGLFDSGSWLDLNIVLILMLDLILLQHIVCTYLSRCGTLWARSRLWIEFTGLVKLAK